jgi:hypothetical protein
MKKFATCLLPLITLCSIQTASAEILAQQITPLGKWQVTTPQELPPIGQALERQKPGRLVYGLYSWAGEYLKYRDDIKKVGWGSVRISGPFDDRIMTALAEDGIPSMVTLGTRIFGLGKKFVRPDYETDEEFLDVYTQAIDKFLKRYGPEGTFLAEHPELPQRPITHIELWNEPNFQYMIPPDDRTQAELEKAREELYAKLMPQVYSTIKPKYPDVSIVGFAAGGAAAADTRFVQHVHELNDEVAESYDIFSTHPYVQPAAPEANAVRSWGDYSFSRGYCELRRILAQYGRGDVPIWYTETGWPISKEDGGTFADTKQDQNEWCVPPLFQAAYVVRIYALALRLNVERVNIMYIYDADGYNGGFFDNATGKWRPSAHAVHTMIDQMPNPKLTGSICDGEDNCYIYTYQADSEQKISESNRVIMAWNVAGPKTVSIPWKKSTAKLTDMLGNTETIQAENGNLEIEIGPFPVYLK